MYLTRFVDIFREQGLAETRSFVTRSAPGLPDDEYALFETYCTDPKCDCRRVMLNVVSRRRMTMEYLASISYGFDREDELAGPFLDLLNSQSKYAEDLLSIIEEEILADSAYLARLESHYLQVKRAAANPSDPAYKRIQAIDRDASRFEAALDEGLPAGSTEQYSLVSRLPRSLATRKLASAPGHQTKAKRKGKRR